MSEDEEEEEEPFVKKVIDVLMHQDVKLRPHRQWFPYFTVRFLIFAAMFGGLQSESRTFQP